MTDSLTVLLTKSAEGNKINISIINNLAIIVIHTTYIILLFTDFMTTCFDPYTIIFRLCHLILGILNHVLQLHILITF
jgi:hypothetical protein